MGNLKGLARGSTSARGGAPIAEDPFAELEQLFQTELNRDPRHDEAARRQGAAPARREPGMDFAFDDLDKQFQAAFETETRGQGRSAPAAAHREAPRKAQGTARVMGSRPVHPTDEEIDHELEEVLRNLSAPARPRDRIVVETQSFAPERAAEERIVHQPPADVDEFEELIRSELAVIRPTSIPAPRQAQRAEPAYESPSYAAPYETDYSTGPMEYGRPVTAGRRWKGRMMAGGSVLAVLVAGGLGVFLLHGASGSLGGGSDEPLLIKADAEPYKIAPKDPGGRAYPNQNKAVYDRVASPNKADATPTQTALLRNAEEPMELPTEEEDASYSDALPGVELGGGESVAVKDETRVTAETEATDGGPEPVLQPRRVKTMRVGADGRLVPNDEPAATSVADPIATAAASVTDVASVVADAAGEARDPVQVSAVPARPVAMPAPKPGSVPAAPVSVPVQTASAMPASGYFVQIASQPSEASAQQSMSSMSGRYANVIAGRPLGIQAAEIPGKGTYYRVRVAAGSKEEAASLCSKLKSAGATCLVTR
ncbi:SPOR domain-containing protein [Aureimonas psammosilenae]|uniref:SPOR domain-containing protein n=1 Tax=Aureimonas psammosilenae TaxID=2495496 RepID=UPI0012604623|nr:SPOR domain-containing protein [Aureimonas psammosilenae]